MGQISSKLRNWRNETNGDEGLIYWCQGCNATHSIKTKGAAGAWGWNGDVDKPTFTPSVLCRTGHYVTGKPADQCEHCKDAAEDGHETFCGICHTFITDGRVQFLSDCTHQYAGQTLELPDLPPQHRDNSDE